MNKSKIRIIYTIGFYDSIYKKGKFPHAWNIKINMGGIENLINRIKTCPEIYKIIIK